MRIAILNGSLSWGGVGRYSLAIAKGLARKTDAEVDWVLFQSEGALRSEIPGYVNIIDLKGYGRRGIQGLRNFPLYMPYSPLIRYLREGKPDIVLGIGGGSNLPAVLVRWLYRLPFITVLTEHSVTSERNRVYKQIGVNSGIGSWARMAVRRLLYPCADYIVGVSNAVINDLLKLGMARSEANGVIHNPIVGEDFEKKLRESVSHPWLAEAEPPVILYLGRIDKVKSVHTIVRAFHTLRTKLRVRARLMIVGDGDGDDGEKLRVEKLVQELGHAPEVRFEPVQKNPFPYVKASSLLVLSSLYEGFGNVVAEALACGTNVVSTDCGGPRDILENGKYGWLVPVGDVEAFALAMKDALEHPKPEEFLRERGRVFSVENAANAYYDLFCELLAKRGAKA